MQTWTTGGRVPCSILWQQVCSQYYTNTVHAVTLLYLVRMVSSTKKVIYLGGWFSGSAPAAAAVQEEPDSEAAAVEDTSIDGAADFSAVGFSYSDGGAAEGADAMDGSGGVGEPYDPGFPVPEHLAPLLRGVSEHSHKVRSLHATRSPVSAQCA